ncbi:MAG: hypothetical protein WBX25_17725 [Rhodomicrobium sp.]
MSASSELIKGWCPGALMPMQSGDGFIVRVRPMVGRLSLEQFETLAEISARFGDGSLYLTNRANVQIRGVSDYGRDAALELLSAAKLADTDSRVESIRNIIIESAIVPESLIEVAATLAETLEQMLAATPALHELPSKFGVSIQSGPIIDRRAISDITFCVQTDCIIMLLESAFASGVFFDSVEAAAEGFLKTAAAFMRFRLARPDMRRMRDAVSRLGAEAMAREATLSLAPHGLTVCEALAPIGERGEAFGIAFLFGELKQAAAREIVTFMRRQKIQYAAVSAHRALVFRVEAQQKAELRNLAAEIEGITDPSDIRLRIHACAGAPSCLRAAVEARRDAQSVLEALRGVSSFAGHIHISACEKRCAYSGAAAITAIGNVSGGYDIFCSALHRKNVRPVELPGIVAALARAS